MGLADRDYMRNRRPVHHCGSPQRRDFLIAAAIVAVGVVIGLCWPQKGVPDKSSMRVNINTASREDLESLPHIGPARAGIIIAARPFKSVDELARLSGISDTQAQEISPFVTVTGNTVELNRLSLIQRVMRRSEALRSWTTIMYLLGLTWALAYVECWIACWRTRRRMARVQTKLNESERRR